MRQTDYGYALPRGVAGGIYDLSLKSIVTRLLDAGVQAVPGCGYVVGATPGQTVAAAQSTSTAANFEGVFVHGSKNLENDRNGVVAAAGADAVGIMIHGRIWVAVADTATTDYGKVVALITDGDNVGMFTDSGDASETTKVTLEGKFLGVADEENGIAVIEI